MRVLLVTPPTSFEQIYGDWDLSPLDTYTPPLGILYVASYIRDHGHDVRIIDMQAKNLGLDFAIKEILSYNPDVVGFSAMTINCLNANKIASELKKNGLSSPIVMGGSHISAVPIETLKRFKAIDYGVIGEGEITFLEIIERFHKGQAVESIEGIVWRDKEDQIFVNEARPRVENLDILPLPAWDLLDNFPEAYPSSLLESKRLPAATIMTSRGCPWQCTFCDHRVFGSKVRHFSASYTLNMIGHVKKHYGIRDLMIIDDNFLLDKKKLFQICDTMIKERMDLTWYCIAHARSMTKDRLLKIKEAGCWFIEVGIESGNNQVLRQIKKNITKAEIMDAVDSAKRAGLKVKGNFIFGFPGDTAETIDETINFAQSLDIDFFQQNFLTIWPGCEISDEVLRDPYNYGGNDWGRLAHQRITYVPPGMTKEQLVKASKYAFRKFYLRPRIFLSFLPLLLSLRGVMFSITALRVFLKTVFRRNPI